MKTQSPTTQSPVRPLPEVTSHGQPFRVVEGPAAVDLVSREFSVPLSTSPIHAALRAHELAHTRWTPPESPSTVAKRHKVNEEDLQVCEDCRINMLAADAGVDLPYLSEGAPDVIGPLVRAKIDANDLRGLVHFIVARAGTSKEQKTILATLRASRTPTARAAITIARIVQHTICESRTTSTAAITGAKQLMDILGAVDRYSKELPPSPSALDFILKGISELDYGELAGMAEEMRCCRWADMRIIQPPRRFPCNPKFRKRVSSPTDCGLALRYIHRFPVDRAIFSGPPLRQTLKGGSVLIDCSGSMSIPYDLLCRYLQRSPLATIAQYSGKQESPYGELVILAKDGRRVQRPPPSHVGNLIDGPALLWLAKQAPPRVWVSDGITTGLGDANYGHAQCEIICQAFNIKRVRRLRCLLED
jgi:hypothetical protein